MKLELKHLVGYLPYGVSFDGKRNGWVNFDGNVKTLCPVDLDGRWETIKPILRPLSDLTKEIEVNGEKFVPLTELLRLSNFDVEKMDYKEQLEFIDSFTNILFMTFDDGQKLLEWHFDIYGLIEKGLAASIHDVE